MYRLQMLVDHRQIAALQILDKRELAGVIAFGIWRARSGLLSSNQQPSNGL